MTSVSDIRARFVNYFARNGHEIVPSSPLVPRNDPTLMFTNSGMVQFKDVFTGRETRPYTRATTAQKCVRAGGKHNDLENVGQTARHHTFFEMLGNFSFGDYFKEDAIKFAWELVTKEFGLPADKLCVTVYHDDDEAANYWKKIAGLSEDKIIRIATSDNFWQMGDTGPCGPCSEIFFDHGDKIWGGPPGSSDESGDRFIEIWNLVFMQFEQQLGGERKKLPKPSVDTGMGLERVSAILQGKHDNYDIDLMRALIEASAAATHSDPDGAHKISHRVIADHLRASAFLIADGVLPSNEGRGYVLRRIMRRAMRHAQMIGAKEPLMYRLFPALQQQMGAAYPELYRAQALITETLKTEEQRFGQTLTRGLKILEDETASLKSGQTLSGETAFTLYDTYGFPLDLTIDALKHKNIHVDETGFDTAMQRQREMARKAWSGSGEAATETLWFDLKEKIGGTEFLGYDTERAEGIITALVQDGKEVQSVTGPAGFMILTNQTPFYGESGGQVGDAGQMKTDGAVIAITDTHKKLGNVFVHHARLTQGTVKVGDAVQLQADSTRRSAIRAHHSATHLLHEALRRALGEHVAQKGSLVAPDRLRFDISHPKAISAEEISAAEAAVNDHIRANTPVTTRLMTPDAAITEGAMALFGEKYGDEVRVVSMGGRASGATGGHDANSKKEYSVELCGGTHVRATGDIGLFKIIAEGAVAAGVRRIEAVTGQAAQAYFAQQEKLLHETAAALKTSAADVPARVLGLIEDRKRLEKELAELRTKWLLSTLDVANAENVGGLKFLGQVLPDVSANELRTIAEKLRAQLDGGVVALIGVADGKGSAIVAAQNLTGRVDAVALVKAAAAAMGGQGGGGRADFAQAGGPDGGKADAAIAAVKKALAD